MSSDEVRQSIVKTLTEQTVNIVLPVAFAGIAGLLVFVVRDQLIPYPYLMLLLLVALASATTLCLVILFRTYLRYMMYREAFGVFWDKRLNARCLSCRKPLKYSSTDAHILYCSDPKCNSKHTLRDSAGNPLSRQDAIDRMNIAREKGRLV